MSARIKLNLSLQTLAQREWISVRGTTVKECLDDLIEKYPEAAGQLYHRDGTLAVSLLLNNGPLIEQILDSPVADKDELWILSVVTGG